MNSHRLFPQIGKVIANTGTRHFPRLLLDLVQAQLAVDAVHIRQVSLKCRPGEDAALLDETVSCAADTDRTGVSTAQRLEMLRCKDGSRYEIILYRAAPGFSLQERTLAEAISPLLLAMLEKHVHVLQPTGRTTAKPTPARSPLHSVESRFTHRLRQNGLVLSRRELEVCVGLLAGHTAPELAQRLDLKVNTVESYLKRAVIKLGIGGRNALMRWMYGSDTTMSKTGQAT